MIAYLGWFANLWVLAGMWLTGNRWRHAFLLSFVGESLWMVHGALRGQWDLAVICGVFAALMLRNWLKWAPA